MSIRDFRPDDAAMLSLIAHKAVHATAGNAYTRAQHDAWSPAPVPADRFLARVSDGRAIFVAVVENDCPVAFIELEKEGHIDCFYSHPDVAGTGIGKALYERLESAARTSGLSRLHVEASEAARRFFIGMGFSQIKRQDTERRGVRIHNYLMEKYF